MDEKDYTLIDTDSIANLIDEVGQSVDIYVPDYTADMAGDVKINYLATPPTTETALIRPRTDTNVVNEQGLQFEGDALGYFKSGTVLVPESEVWVKFENYYLIYFVISVQPSRFEGELKFKKGVLQKRRTEPIPENLM